MNNQGKSAVELVMDYGWMFFIGVVVFTSLNFFGVLTPQTFVSERCFLPSGFACIDYSYTDSGIQVLVQNSLGQDVSDVYLIVDNSHCSAVASGPTSLQNNERGLYNFDCFLSSNFKAELELEYVNLRSGMSHLEIGELFLKIPNA